MEMDNEMDVMQADILLLQQQQQQQQFNSNSNGQIIN
jgi:hypothetical protein